MGKKLLLSYTPSQPRRTAFKGLLDYSWQLG